MERLVPLSTIEYFTQKNMMLGSLTPESYIAQPLAMIFNYRAYAKDERLVAEYFIDNKCYDLTDKDKVCAKDFDLTVEGIDQAAAWLEAEYRIYERNTER